MYQFAPPLKREAGDDHTKNWLLEYKNVSFITDAASCFR